MALHVAELLETIFFVVEFNSMNSIAISISDFRTFRTRRLFRTLKTKTNRFEADKRERKRTPDTLAPVEKTAEIEGETILKP
jgi:hypothetical protein